MTSTPVLDLERMRKLFDLRGGFFELNGGWFEDDPYPIWRDLRERGPVHEGTVHELSGLDRPALFHGLPYPELPHYSVFSYEACDGAYRDAKVFASAPVAEEFDKGAVSALNSMLSMDGGAASPLPLVGPAVVRARKGPMVDPELDRADGAPADRPLRGRRGVRSSTSTSAPRSRC